jgi:type IV pilus assembly protein PilV
MNMKNKQKKSTPFIKQQGLTFLEVLIAVVILVTGILGAVAMQASAKQASFDAMQRSLASSLAQDIIERMRGNNANNIALYQVGSPFGAGDVVAAVDCSVLANNCNSNQIAFHDLFEWEQALIGSGTKNGDLNVGGLINGVGCINVNGNRIVVAISWQGKTELADGASSTTGVACGTSGKNRRQVVINAFIM